MLAYPQPGAGIRRDRTQRLKRLVLDSAAELLKKWVKPTRVSRVLDRAGFVQVVRHDPKGVVGIIGPWHFPLYLTIVPAGSALAEGNRVVIRPSSVTARTTELLCTRAPEYFAVDELAVLYDRIGVIGVTEISRRRPIMKKL